MKEKVTYKECIGAGLIIGVSTLVVVVVFPAPLPSNPCTVSKVLTFSCFYGGRGQLFMATAYALIISGLVWGFIQFLKRFKTKSGSNGQ
jgi:hypothetical protein